MKVLFSPDADQDLDELYLWIGSESIRSADQLMNDIINFCFDDLPENPNIGRPYDKGLRLFMKRGYRIFYRVGDVQIDIVRVLHSARDSDRIMS